MSIVDYASPILSAAVLSVGALATAKIWGDIKRKRQIGDTEEAPEIPNKAPIVGHTFFLLQKEFALDFFLEKATLTPTFRFQLPFQTMVLTTDPLVIKRFLSTGFKEGIYEKSKSTIEAFRDVFGDGIFTSNGEVWKEQRKFAAPLFSKHSLESYITLFKRNAENLCDIFSTIIHSNSEVYEKEGIDLQEYFMRYTLDSFCEIGFGVNIRSMYSKRSALKFQRSFDFLQTFSDYRNRLGNMWKIKEYFYPSTEFLQHLNYVERFIWKIVQRRSLESEEELQPKSDLLSQMLLQNLQQKRETGNIVHSDKQIRDWVMNFLIAGRDTTALLLTWSFYLLSLPNHSFALQNVREELSSLLLDSLPSLSNPPINNNDNIHIDQSECEGENEGEQQWREVMKEFISFDLQKRQKYLHKVLQEALRLYPPVPIDGYIATRDDVIQTSENRSLLIKKGSMCFYSAWATHRSPNNFDHPETFDPDRFDSNITPFSFVPFHAGPRICLGQEMALIEAKIVTSYLLSRFNFSLKNPSDVIPRQAVVLTAKNGVRAYLSPRV